MILLEKPIKECVQTPFRRRVDGYHILLYCVKLVQTLFPLTYLDPELAQYSATVLGLKASKEEPAALYDRPVIQCLVRQRH